MLASKISIILAKTNLELELEAHTLCGGASHQFYLLTKFELLTPIPGPGLEMQHAILLICFVSSFASLGKVLLLEDENTGGCRLGIFSNSPYNVGKALSEREQVAIGKLPEYQVLTLKIQIYRLCRISHSRIP